MATIQAVCPSNTSLTGGGYRILSISFGTVPHSVLESRPTSFNSEAWLAVVGSDSDWPYTIEVAAFCAHDLT